MTNDYSIYNTPVALRPYHQLTTDEVVRLAVETEKRLDTEWMSPENRVVARRQLRCLNVELARR
jgi:hypothetical protein